MQTANGSVAAELTTIDELRFGSVAARGLDAVIAPGPIETFGLAALEAAAQFVRNVTGVERVDAYFARRFETAVRLVQLRGRYMQEAVPPGKGSMAAIVGLDELPPDLSLVQDRYVVVLKSATARSGRHSGHSGNS